MGRSDLRSIHRSRRAVDGLDDLGDRLDSKEREGEQV